MAIFDDGAKAFLEAYTYFSNLLGKGREKLAKEFAEQATGVKAPNNLEPVIPGNEVIRILSKTEKGELMSINSQLSNPMKSDFINSKMDGTVGNRYAVLRSELDRMSPQVTQDLQYAKDNQLALTTIQKNNLVQNVKLERQLKQELKRLETDLIADKKDPQMIMDAYKQSTGRLKEIDEYSKSKSELRIKNNTVNKYDSKGYGPNESVFRTITRNFLTAEQKAGRIEMPTNIYQRISFGGVDSVVDPIKLFRYHYGDDAFDKIPVEKLEELFANKGLREQDYKYILREAGITPVNKKGPQQYEGYFTPKELKAELNDIDELNNIILAGDSPFYKTKSEMVYAIKNNNNRRAKFATILKDMEFKKILDEEITPDFIKQVAPKKAGQGRFTKSEVLIARLENTIKTSKDPYVLENFPNFIKEIKAKPELANNKNVFDTLSGPLPKGQRLVEYDDGTMDFFQKTDFGPQNIPPTQKLAEELGISIEEASAILKMEPEDQVLEIGRRKALSDRIDNLVDDTLSEEPTSLYDENFKDYFDPDDKPNQAKGGIISLT